MIKWKNILWNKYKLYFVEGKTVADDAHRATEILVSQDGRFAVIESKTALKDKQNIMLCQGNSRVYAKVIRKECRKRDIPALKVVYSKEEAMKVNVDEEPAPGKKSVPGSISFVPSVAGLIIAGEVIKDLIKEE